MPWIFFIFTFKSSSIKFRKCPSISSLQRDFIIPESWILSHELKVYYRFQDIFFNSLKLLAIIFLNVTSLSLFPISSSITLSIYIFEFLKLFLYLLTHLPILIVLSLNLVLPDYLLYCVEYWVYFDYCFYYKYCTF